MMLQVATESDQRSREVETIGSHAIPERSHVALNGQSRQAVNTAHFNTCVDQFRSYLLENGYSASTIRAYFSDACQFLAWLIRMEVDLESVDRKTAHAYIINLRQSSRDTEPGACGPYAWSTIRRKRAAVCSLFQFLSTRGIADGNPFRKMEALPSHSTERAVKASWFNLDQIQDMLAACRTDTPKGIRDHALIALIAILGLSVAEARRLDLIDVDFADGSIRVTNKAGLERLVPISPELLVALKRWINTRNLLTVTDQALFVSLHWGTARADSGRRLSVRGIRKVINLQMRAIGAKQPNISCEALRRSSLINFSEKGAEDWGMSVFFGLSLKTIRAYQQISEAVLGK